LGFSTSFSALSIAAVTFLTRGRGRSPGRSGSFIHDPFAHTIQQFTREQIEAQIISNFDANAHTRIAARGETQVCSRSYQPGMNLKI
jgi:hypothetical protein